MIPKSTPAFLVIIVIFTLALGAAAPGTTPVYAAQEDAALFQSALSGLGQWLNHGQHGMVWRPTQVSRNWRPYTNGRWVPTQEGYVFETDEPWGWATYHYGNWMPTNEHGWVWSPGRTWYPHTVNWRTSDQNVGWAPVPPPEYTSSDNYYSGGYPDGGYDSPTGLNSYGSSMNGISPTSWSFTRASDFLLGYGQPYASSYSYAYAGVLAAPQYIPTIYERTVYVNNYVSPSSAPRACYNWGPPVTYITKVTKNKNIEIDHRYRDLRHAHLRNVMPPANLAQRHPAWREILPGDGATRQGQIRSVANIKTASGGLNRPDAIPAPLSLNRRQAETAAPNGVLGPGSRPPVHQASETGPQQPPDNRNTRRDPSEDNQVTRPPERFRGPHSSRLAVTNSTTAGTGGRIADPSLPKPSAPTETLSRDVKKQTPPSDPSQRQIQPFRGHQRDEQQVVHENQQRRHQEQRLQQEQQRASQEQRGRQHQQRLEMERQQQQARACQAQQQQQARSQQHLQEEQQRRQAEMQRQQKIQQMQQQQRQAEMQRAQQMRQQQVVRQAPPPPPQQAPPPQRQKRQDNQNQQ